MYGVIVLLAYFLLMMGATVILTKREVNIEGFYVGNRNMGTLSAAMSIAATWIWAPALFVSADRAYTNGLPGLFWFLVPNILCLILFIPFAKKIRKEMPQGITLSGFMGEKYQSNKVKGVYLFQLTSLTILSTGVQLLAGGKILSTITGLPFPLMTVILAAIAFSYSQFSGIRASVLTDAIQMVLILGACVIFVPWALNIDNGISSLMAGLAGKTGEYTSLFTGKGLEVFFAFGLPTAIGLIAGPFGDQCFWQRTFAINEKKIGKAFLIGAILFGIVPLSMGILGFIAAGSGFEAINSGIVNFELITHMFPKWVVLPFLFMLISGLLSTVDSNLCAVASLTSDIVKKSDMLLSKVAMTVLLALGIAIANIPGLTITYLFLIYGTLRATTLLPTVMTLKGIKLTANGVCSGVITALVIGLPIFAYGTILNISLYKTIGSLTTVLSAGAVAFIISRLEVCRA
jgi:Na+/proline symporter